MRMAIYARVSTDDKGQDPENQLCQLRDWCRHTGHDIVAEYIDHEGGQFFVFCAIRTGYEIQ
jgi:DNA invertase Pin-like site-specific DNA recombinase